MSFNFDFVQKDARRANNMAAQMCTAYDLEKYEGGLQVSVPGYEGAHTQAGDGR